MLTLLVSPSDLVGDELVIDGDAYRHLFRSRRLATGFRLRVVDGEGHARWGEVVDVDRRQGTASLGPPAPDNEPCYDLHLAVGALRPERSSWLVEKATELGVRKISFFNSERTSRQYGKSQLERLQRVARSAVEQCHRSRVPEIASGHDWDEMVAILGLEASQSESFVLFPGGGPMPSTPENGPGPTSGQLVIGPEGGLSDRELQELVESVGCRSVTLGRLILRVETAAIVGASWLLVTRDQPDAGKSW